MKAICLILAVSASLPACAQGPVPSPFAPPAPSSPGEQTPRFRYQPPQTQRQFKFGGPLIMKPVPRPSSPDDAGIIRHPKGFVQHPGKPILQNLYPGLQLMPVEQAPLDQARLDAPTAPNPGVKALPIPRIFPKAKLDPIPTTWEKFTLLPIQKP